VLAAAVWLAGAGAAHGGVKKIADGRDTGGKLDIRSAAHGHKGGAVTHTITTYGKWSKSTLGLRTSNAFGIGISTRGNSNPERFVIAFAQGGRMQAFVFRHNGTFAGQASAAKLNARSLRITIPVSLLGSPASYRWQAFSYFEKAGRCAGGCLDVAPDRSLVLHDLMRPTILFPAPPAPTSTEYDIEFGVQDQGGSGLRSWRLERRTLGEEDWSVVASGTSGGAKVYNHVGSAGDSDEWRVVAVDGEGNRSVSPIRLVTIPPE
jgi:hypothetical protein